MVRVNAAFVVAQVVDYKPSRNRSFPQFIGHSVGRNRLCPVPAFSVAIPTVGSPPFPAFSGTVDATKESFKVGASKHDLIVVRGHDKR